MNRMERIAFLVAAAIVSYQLFLPPVAGLANNGDFGKVLGIFDLAAPVEDEYKYAPTKYTFDPSHHIWFGFYSSETLLVVPAMAVNRIFSQAGVFDLRAIGLIHGALFLFAVYKFLPLIGDLQARWRLLILCLVLFVFCDAMYVSFFNSFYMDTAALLFLFLAVVSLLRALRWQWRADRIWLLVWCVLLVMSKTQHCALGIPIAILFLWQGSTLAPTGPRLFAGVAAGVMLAAALFSWRGAPRDYAPKGYYSVIFLRVLPASKDVRADLKDLGLDESYRPYIGRHAYSEDARMQDPEFVRDFSRRTSYARLAWFFLRRPSLGYLLICASLGEAGRQRPLLGNFDRSAGLPPFTESSRFTLWSSLKKKLFFGNGWRYLLYSLLLASLVSALLITRKRLLPRGLAESGFILIAMAFLEMLVASLADAVDVTRHFSLFNAMLDVLFLSAVALVFAAKAHLGPQANSGRL